MAHYALKISFSILTIERFRKIIKFENSNFFVTEMPQWLKHEVILYYWAFYVVGSIPPKLKAIFLIFLIAC